MTPATCPICSKPLWVWASVKTGLIWAGCFELEDCPASELLESAPTEAEAIAKFREKAEREGKK